MSESKKFFDSAGGAAVRPTRPMTQVTLTPRSVAPAPPDASGGDAPGEPPEDPDSPGLPPRSAAPFIAPVKAAGATPSHREPLADPLAEPVAALLGAALALLTLMVPLLAVLGEGRGESTSSPATPETTRVVVLGAERINPEPINSQ